MNIKLTSKFCPHCSNPRATDGSYQEVGAFSIMEEEIKFGNSDKPEAVVLCCPLCYYNELIWEGLE